MAFVLRTVIESQKPEPNFLPRADGSALNFNFQTKKRNPGIGIFFLLYVFYWSASSCIVPYLGPYYELRGLGGVQIGLLGGLMSVITMFASLLAGSLADSWNRPKIVICGCCIGLMGTAVLLRFSSFYRTLILTSGLFYFLNAPIQFLTDKLLLDNLQKQPERYSWFRLGGSLGYCLGSFTIGFIIARRTLFSVFPIFILTIGLCAILLPFIPVPLEQKKKEPKPAFRGFTEILHHRRFFFIYGTMTLFGLVEAALTFYALHLKNHNYTPQSIGFLLATTMIGEIVGFLFIPRLLKQAGPEKVIALSFICQIIRSGSLALILPMPFMVLCQFIGGFSFPMIWASITHLINETFSSRMGNLAQGLKTLANSGLAQLIGIPLAGILYQYVSSNSIFWSITVMSCGYVVAYGLYQVLHTRKTT
jgi:PPP family 3-phenylpropionic acid transporter